MKELIRAISFRRFFEHKLRSLLTVIGIALGVASFIAVTIITSTLSDSFAKMVDLVAGRVNLQITGGPTGVDEKILDQVKKIPGVQAVAPVIQNYTKTDDGQALLLLAVDTLNDKAVRDFKMQDAGGSEISDPLLFLNTQNAILLNKDFAKKNGIRIDSTILLLTTQGKRPFMVRGLLDPKGTAEAFGGRFALMDVYAAQIYFGKQGLFDSIDILVKEGENIDTVKQRIQSALEGSYTVQRPAQRAENVENLMATFRSGLAVLSMIVLIMGMFIIFNTVYTSVYQRKREIGILRMVGLTRTGIIFLFCFEGLIMGLLGSVIGVGAGYSMGSISVRKFAANVSSLFVMVDTSHAVFKWAKAGIGVMMGTGISFLASLYPAWRASTFTPLEVVRYGVGLSYGKGVMMYRYIAALILSLAGLSVGLFLPEYKGTIDGVRMAMISLLVAAVAVTPIFMKAFLTAFGRFNLGKGGALRRLATENILRDLGRAAMTVAAFMLGLAVMFEIYIFVRSIKHEIQEWLVEALKSDIVITSSSSFANRASIPVDGSLADKIKEVEGVEGVVRVRLLLTDYKKTRIHILALELEKYMNIHRFQFVDHDRPEAIVALRNGEGVLLTQNLLISCPEFKGAEKITLNTPRGLMDFKVLGVIMDYTSETGAVVMERNMFIKYFKDNLVDTFQVYLKPGTPIMETRKKIYDLFGQDFNLYVLTNREFRASVLDAIDQMFQLAFSLEVIAMIIAFIGIVNNLMATVIDRTREIGVLRAIGSTKGQVARIFITHAGLLGLSGALLAVVAGFGLGAIHVHRLTQVYAGYAMAMQYSWMHIIVAIVASVCVGIVAGFLPARRAAGLLMHEALKYE